MCQSLATKQRLSCRAGAGRQALSRSRRGALLAPCSSALAAQLCTQPCSSMAGATAHAAPSGCSAACGASTPPASRRWASGVTRASGAHLSVRRAAAGHHPGRLQRRLGQQRAAELDVLPAPSVNLGCAAGGGARASRGQRSRGLGRGTQPWRRSQPAAAGHAAGTTGAKPPPLRVSLPLPLFTHSASSRAKAW